MTDTFLQVTGFDPLQINDTAANNTVVGVAAVNGRTGTVILTAGDVGAALPDAQGTNVKNHGAVGDGITDDTAAIQAVLDGLSPGATAIFPPGDYLVSSLSVLNKNKFTIRGRAARIITTTTTVGYFTFTGCTDFTVRGLRMEAQTSAIRRSAVNGMLTFTNCNRFRVLDNQLMFGEGTGTFTQNSTDATFCSNYVDTTLADGMHTKGGSKRISYIGNVINTPGDDGIAVVSYQASGLCDTVSVAGNVIYQSNARGIAVVGGQGVTISGNTINKTKAGGIYVAYESAFTTYGVTDVTISGNTVLYANTYNPSTNQHGIHVHSSSASFPVSGVSVTGNTVEGSNWNGIVIGDVTAGTSDVSVIGNVVRNSGNTGLAVNVVNNGVVNSNLVEYSNAYGIWLSNATGAWVVSGNSVINPNIGTPTGYGYWLNTAAITQGIAMGNAMTDSGVNTTHTFTTAGAWTLSGNAGGAASGDVGTSQYAFRATDSSPVNNSTTLVADDTLKFNVLAGQTYSARFILNVVGVDTTADIKIGCSTPTSSTGTINLVTGVVTTATGGSGSETPSEIGINGSFACATFVSTNTVVVDVIVSCVNSGVANLQFAQNTATVSDLKLGAFSRMTATRIA